MNSSHNGAGTFPAVLPMLLPGATLLAGWVAVVWRVAPRRRKEAA